MPCAYIYCLNLLPYQWWFARYVSAVDVTIVLLTGNLQLAVIQVAGAIANAVVVKNAGTFSLIPEKGFHISASVRVFLYFFGRYSQT